MIAYNDKQYYIDIVETKPSHAVTIVETDCEVDFVQPLDYEEPEKPMLSATSSGKDCTQGCVCNCDLFFLEFFYMIGGRFSHKLHKWRSRKSKK